MEIQLHDTYYVIPQSTFVLLGVTFLATIVSLVAALRRNFRVRWINLAMVFSLTSFGFFAVSFGVLLWRLLTARGV